MAKLVFTRTNDEFKRTLILGGMTGVMVGMIFFIDALDGNVEALLYTLGSFFGCLLVGGLFGLAAKSYRSNCSACGANLTRFCDRPEDDSFIHCPACGEKFEQ
jgi:hypothetical protein